MTYEIINGWIVGKLPAPDGGLMPVKQPPQGPYDRRQRNNPLLCLHTTETHGYVEDLRFPSEFQMGDDVIGQHRPLWARGSAVDEHDDDLLQIEIVGFSRLDPWLPKPESLVALVALMALLHRRGSVATALKRPDGWPVRLDRPPAAVDTYYRRREVWDDRSCTVTSRSRRRALGPGFARPSGVVSIVRDVLPAKQVDGEMLSDSQIEGIEFANGMRRYLDGPANEPAEPGPNRQGSRFARRITMHIEDEPAPAGFEPGRSSTEGMHLPPDEKHPGPEEEEGQKPRTAVSEPCAWSGPLTA